MKQSQKQKDFQLRLVEEREGPGREKVKETLAGLVWLQERVLGSLKAEISQPQAPEHSHSALT